METAAPVDSPFKRSSDEITYAVAHILGAQNLMGIRAVRPMSLTPCTKSCTFSRRQDAGISYLQDRHPFRRGLVWTFICLLWRCVCIPQSSGESHCHLVQRTTQETYPHFNKETNVRFDEAIELALNKTNAGLLLYVTDCVNVDEDALNFACWLVERHGAHIELLCVIDPGRAVSSPDAQMGIQYRLETLARTVRHLTLTKNAEAVLLFGCADDVIPKRAAAVHARLVALQMNNSANYNAQEKQVRRIAAKCDCPILAFRQRETTHDCFRSVVRFYQFEMFAQFKDSRSERDADLSQRPRR